MLSLILPGRATDSTIRAEVFTKQIPKISFPSCNPLHDKTSISKIEFSDHVIVFFLQDLFWPNNYMNYDNPGTIMSRIACF